jgi:hypothetical protein
VGGGGEEAGGGEDGGGKQWTRPTSYLIFYYFFSKEFSPIAPEDRPWRIRLFQAERERGEPGLTQPFSLPSYAAAKIIFLFFYFVSQKFKICRTAEHVSHISKKVLKNKWTGGRVATKIDIRFYKIHIFRNLIKLYPRIS